MSLEKDDLDNYKFDIEVFKYRRDIRVEFICWWENNYFIGFFVLKFDVVFGLFI